MTPEKMAKHNFLFMLLEGTMFYIGFSLMQTDTVIARFIDFTAHSTALIGLAASISSSAFLIGQVIGGAYLHRVRSQLHHMLRMAVVSRVLMLILAAALWLGLRGPAAAWLFLLLYTVFLCYLLEERAVNWLFFGMCAANAGIALLEMPKYGIAQSVSSVITCLVTFGEAEGFVRALEIHDITFLFGQFFIYYMMFAPKSSRKDKRIRRLGIALSIFFILLGLKRSVLPAVFVVCIYVKLLRFAKKPGKFLLATGIGLAVFFWFYLYLTRSGILVAFLESLGIDMMGRDVLWSLPNKYYELSLFWKGLGFEAVTDLVNQWHQAGLINRAYPLHNDILRIFIELGALGFLLWEGIFYILYPAYWMRRHDMQTGLFYMAVLLYMTLTYLTDNTAFYFWSCIGLRLIPMSYSYRIRKSEKQVQWKAPTPEEAADEIWLIEMRGKGENAR